MPPKGYNLWTHHLFNMSIPEYNYIKIVLSLPLFTGLSFPIEKIFKISLFFSGVLLFLFRIAFELSIKNQKVQRYLIFFSSFIYILCYFHIVCRPSEH